MQAREFGSKRAITKILYLNLCSVIPYGSKTDRIRTSIIAHKDKHGRIYAFGRKEAGKARKAANKSTKFKFGYLGRKGATKEERALYKLLKHGHETVNEGLLWLDKKYNQLLPFKTGSNNSVGIGEARELLKRSADESIISTHNHPNSSAFSPEDLDVACSYTSIDTLQVVGHDGTRYFMKIGGGYRPELSYIRHSYDVYFAELIPQYRRQLNGGESPAEALKEITHTINVRLSERFGWEYKRELL